MSFSSFHPRSTEQLRWFFEEMLNFEIYRLKGRVFAPRYRLAPSFPFPCGLQDLLAAYLYLLTIQFVPPPPNSGTKELTEKSQRPKYNSLRGRFSRGRSLYRPPSDSARPRPSSSRRSKSDIPMGRPNALLPQHHHPHGTRCKKVLPLFPFPNSYSTWSRRSFTTANSL